MSNPCRDLDKLSAERKWDDVFQCLNIDVNSTIELGSLKIPRSTDADDRWLEDQKATTNSLEVILAIILFFDQLFYLALMWYLFCFAFKFMRFRGLYWLKRALQKIGLCAQQTESSANVGKTACVIKKKSLTFAKSINVSSK